LVIALVLTAAFVIIETAAGLYSNSLALLADAGHNLTDVAALALSWYAMRLSRRPANQTKTYGYHRAGILAALLNSTTLAVIAIFIFAETIARLRSPESVQSSVIIAVAALAFVVNLGTAWLLRRHDGDLNMRSAFIHLAGDALSTLGTLVAGIGIALTGWNILDPLASVLIGLLILVSAWQVLRETIDILLEGAPRGIEMNTLVGDLLEVQGVRGVHDLHAWSITANLRALSAHILTEDITLGQGASVQRDINVLLLNKYQIAHTTLQLECEDCMPDDLFCELDGGD
jgi:cobalt-zinc-cadmium efflux system protein